MAQSTNPHYYYLNFRTIGSWHIARINDVTFTASPKAERSEVAVPINTYLKAGENELSFTFVPTWSDANPVGEPNSTFAVRANLTRYDLVTRAEEEFTILHAAFDIEAGQLVPVETTSLGPSAGPGRAGFGNKGRFAVGDAVYEDIFGPPVPARKITVKFFLDADLRPMTWASAPVLENTPELRQEVLTAYRKVHNALASGNFTSVQTAYELAWGRAAKVMAYESIDEYVQVNKVSVSLAPTTGEGAVLAEPTFLPSPSDVRLDFMAQGRVVRFDPHPIRWYHPDNPDKVAFYSAVVFFREEDGKPLRVAMVPYFF